MAETVRRVVGRLTVNGVCLGAVLSVEVNRRPATPADKNGKPLFEVYTVRVPGPARGA